MSDSNEIPKSSTFETLQLRCGCRLVDEAPSNLFVPIRTEHCKRHQCNVDQKG